MYPSIRGIFRTIRRPWGRHDVQARLPLGWCPICGGEIYDHQMHCRRCTGSATPVP